MPTLSSLRAFLMATVVALGLMGPALALDTVTVEATKPVARESDAANQQGEFVFRRSGSSGALVVYVKVRQTGAVMHDATDGVDYTLSIVGGASIVPSSITAGASSIYGFPITFQAGSRETKVAVRAITDSIVEGAEWAWIDIEPQSTYVTGADHTAGVVIADANMTSELKYVAGQPSEGLSPWAPEYGLATQGGQFRLTFLESADIQYSRSPILQINDLIPGGVFPNGAKLGVTTVSQKGRITVNQDYGLVFSIAASANKDYAPPSASALIDQTYAVIPRTELVYGRLGTTNYRWQTGAFGGTGLGTAAQVLYGIAPEPGAVLKVRVSGGTIPTGFKAGTYTLSYGGATFTFVANPAPLAGQFTLAKDGDSYVLIIQQAAAPTDLFAGGVKLTASFKTTWQENDTVGTGGAVTAGANKDSTWTVAEQVVYPGSDAAGQQQTTTGIHYKAERNFNVGDVFQFGHKLGGNQTFYRVTHVDTVNQFIYFEPPLTDTISVSDGEVYLTRIFPANFRNAVTGEAVGRQKILMSSMSTSARPYPDATDWAALTSSTNLDSIWISVVTNDDQEVEGAEEIRLTMETSDEYDVLSPQVASVSIKDDDSSMSVVRVADAGEPNLSGSFQVTATRVFPEDVKVYFQISGTATYATGANLDFTIQNLDSTTGMGYVVLPKGQTSVSVNVSPTDDTRTEGSESVTLTLLPANDYVLAGSESGDANSRAATLSILDLIGTVEVASTVPTAQESAVAATTGVFTVSMTRSGTADALVLFTLSGSAGITDDDYQVIFPSGTVATYDVDTHTGSITFATASVGAVQTAQVNILPGDDAVVEDDEVVTLTLNPYPGIQVVTTSQSAQVKILDDEPTIKIETYQDATEPTTATAAAQRGRFLVSYEGAAIGRAITVHYTVSSFDTATPGMDYGALSGSIEIPATTNNVFIEVNPSYDNDTTKDPNETVTVTLSTGTDYRIDALMTTARIIILEASVGADSGAAVQLAATQIIADAGSTGYVRVRVNRLTRYGTLTVNYETVDGTALAGTNYEALTGIDATLMWADNDRSPRFIEIPLKKANATDSTFYLALSNPTTEKGDGSPEVINTIQGSARATVILIGSSSTNTGGDDVVPVTRDATKPSGCGQGVGIAAMLGLMALGFTRRQRKN